MPGPTTTSRKKKRSASQLLRKKSSATFVKSRQRLSPEVRRTQILDAAAALIVKQGFLPLSVERLAEAAGSSKALIYTYFATQHDLFNALLRRELTALASAGMETASRVDNLDQAVLLCAMLYFEQVVQCGPLIHILLTDMYMSGHIESESVHAGESVLQRLLQLAKRTLELSKKDAQAALEMLATIPEEAAGFAFHGELQPVVARRICHSLMLSSLQALRSPDRIIASVEHGM